MCKQAGDRGDVVIQKRCIAIADTRGPVTAMLLSLISNLNIQADRNQILLVGLHQGACRLIPPGLHRVESVSSRCRGCAKDVRRRRLVNLLLVRVRAWVSVVNEPSETEYG